MIREIEKIEDKEKISRMILEDLPEWFGIPEAREEYIRESRKQKFFCCFEEGRPVGFVCLKKTGRDTAELSVIGVLKEYHRHGIGRQLFHYAKKAAAHNGFSFLQVKTVRMGQYPQYDDTNMFYISLGFKEFEVFPALWDAHNPCQIYIMSLQ